MDSVSIDSVPSGFYHAKGTGAPCQRICIWIWKKGEAHVPIYDCRRSDLDSVVYRFECHPPPAWPTRYGFFSPCSRSEEKSRPFQTTA